MLILKCEALQALFCPDALVALRTAKQRCLTAVRPCEALQLRPTTSNDSDDRIQNRIDTFILFDANQRICVLRPASRDMRTDVRSATSTMPSAREPEGSTAKRHLTGKVLANNSRMSSLHDVVKNRRFTPKCEPQTCFRTKG